GVVVGFGVGFFVFFVGVCFVYFGFCGRLFVGGGVVVWLVCFFVGFGGGVVLGFGVVCFVFFFGGCVVFGCFFVGVGLVLFV
ncbi:hypothetical protein DVA80_21165, partial [Acinetobacter baumannii]|uniref:hypothetical protein n=1 Tax=Acinetobacter baumannii TaxID=470 RepID=UPI000E0465C1